MGHVRTSRLAVRTSKGARGYPRQELALRHQAFRRQSHGFTDFLQRTEIHMGGEVLLARTSEHIGCEMMTMVSPQSPLPSLRRKKFLVGQAIIES